MPNWVTVKIKADSHVIESVNSAKNKFDFNNVIEFTGDYNFEMISMSVEDEAKRIVKSPFSTHPLIASLEKSNREKSNIDSLSDNDFEDLVKMLKNYRKTGYFHQMDFAKEKWGTKWNSSEVVVNLSEGTANFETAWSCPFPILEQLSKNFPETVIDVEYADEDIGSNCGFFSLKNGEYIKKDIAPRYNERTENENEKWRKYACAITGRDYDDYKNNEEEIVDEDSD